MTVASLLEGRTEQELAAIRLGILAKQEPTTITALVVDESAVFDDALRGARDVMQSGTPILAYEPLPPSFARSFAPVGEDWLLPVRVGDSQELVLEVGEWTRRAYDLSVGTLGQLTGGSGRRYQEYREGAPMPADKQALLAEAVGAVGELGAIDPYATRVLFRGDPDAVVLLTERNYQALLERFEIVRDRLVRTARTVIADVATRFISEADFERVRALAASPDFAKALAVLDVLLPETHVAREGWRVVAKVELDNALRRYEEDSQITERWSFLADLDDLQWASFVRDAHAMLSNPHLGEAEWHGWLRDTASHAEASAPRTALLPPATLPSVRSTTAVTVASAIAEGRLSGRNPFKERAGASQG